MTAPPPIFYDISNAGDGARTGIGRLQETILRAMAEVMERGAWTVGPVVCVSCRELALTGGLQQRLQAAGVQFLVRRTRSLYLFRLFVLPWLARRHGARLVVLPEPFFSPLPLGLPYAVTLNDLLYVDDPASQTRHIQALYRTLAPGGLRGARAVGAISHFTAQRAEEVYGGMARKAVVLPMAVDGGLLEQAPAEPTAHGVPERFALFVGNLMPRKNVRALVEAFRAWKRTAGEEFAPLVVVGRARPEIDDVEPLLRAALAEGAIVRLGKVDNALLAGLYRRALFFAFPSLYEGFGLPIIEAMALGCPVLTARGSATTEAAGDAALLVDPRDPAALLAGIRELASDHGLRARLVAAGHAHVARLTPERLGLAFQELLRKGLSGVAS